MKNCRIYSKSLGKAAAAAAVGIVDVVDLRTKSRSGDLKGGGDWEVLWGRRHWRVVAQQGWWGGVEALALEEAIRGGGSIREEHSGGWDQQGGSVWWRLLCGVRLDSGSKVGGGGRADWWWPIWDPALGT